MRGVQVYRRERPFGNSDVSKTLATSDAYSEEQHIDSFPQPVTRERSRFSWLKLPWGREKPHPAPPAEPSRRFRSALDAYCNVYLASPVRLRVKHTLAFFRRLKVKSEVSMRIGQAPHIALKVKALGCLEYRVTSAGNSFRVRTAAPLNVPHTTVDILYEHHPEHSNSVRLAFRLGNLMFIKVPEISTGMKAETRLNRHLKSSIRMHRKFVTAEDMNSIRGSRPAERRKPFREFEKMRLDIQRTLKLSEMYVGLRFRCMHYKESVDDQSVAHQRAGRNSLPPQSLSMQEPGHG